MSLLIEEKKRRAAEEFGRASGFGFSFGGGRILMDGTHAPEKLKTIIPSRWELSDGG
jgi:hypothetical protein